MSLVGVPVGTVLPFAGLATALKKLKEDGWLYCDGSDVTQRDYPELFQAIGTTYGGNGPEFHLPDLRGMFMRGVDDGRGKDPDISDRVTQQGEKPEHGSIIGTMQGDAVASHDHTWQGYYRCQGGGGRECWSRDRLDDPAVRVDQTGGKETRPKNVAVYYIIKARP